MRTWTRIGGAALVLTFALAAGARARDDDEKKPLTDADFVKTAASLNKEEIELGEIGQVKGTDPDVKMFAKHLVIDHSKSLNELRDAAKPSNIPVPDEMLPKHKEAVAKFKSYTGSNFDQDFIKHMVEGHEKAVKLFTKASKECKDEQLKGYAEKTLPGLKEHLDKAKKIQERLDKK